MKNEDKTEIRVSRIVKTYKGGVKALNGIDLYIPGGSRFVLLGPNGAGKSTLIRILTSLSLPDSGEVRVCGLDPQRNTRSLMEKIGVVSQDHDLDPRERVDSHLLFQGRLFGLSKRQALSRADELIALFGLGEHAGKTAEKLSGGNKRRLHCALALVHKPNVLFLDEPTVGMDPEIRSAFWTALRNIQSGEKMTIFLTTQYLEEAEKHAGLMAMLRAGRIEYFGTVSRFKKEVIQDRDSSLEESYLELMKKDLPREEAAPESMVKIVEEVKHAG